MKVLKKRANNVAIILVAVLILFDLSPLAVSATNKEAGLYITASYNELPICRHPERVPVVSTSLYEIMEKQGTVVYDSTIRFIDEVYESRVVGTWEEYSVGRFGVFDGLVSRKEQLVPITISISFINQNNCFLIVAIGEADDDLELFCFGEYTEEVKKLNIEKNEHDKKDRERELTENSSYVNSLRLDNTCRYQNTYTSSQNGYEHVTISAYHANEVENAGSAQVVAKINSHTSSFENYLQNVYGLNASGSIVHAYPDKYTITVIMNNPYLDFSDASPTSGSTSHTFSLPVYLPIIGLQIFSISHTVSETDCNITSTNSSFSNNIIEWTVYKRNGFPTNQMNGYYDSTNKGGMVKAIVSQHSSITSQVNVSVQTSGKLRYQVDYMVPPNNYYEEYDLYQYCLWGKEANCNSVIKMMP